ncbi:MAG TPA: UDP-N-acetylmuramate dehydrogenase [Terracidiphilus sp.]|nr:UDP-N-acetylmuramate dehydrogenase [Terracidiphilus sp.]
MQIKESQLLAPFTTFGVGGPARWFVEAATEAEVAEASEWARERGVPLFVLGGGSNVLVADAGFAGLVLRIALKGIERDGERFRVASGEDWDAFVDQAIGAGFAGVECLAGIPGTVGGTPVQNVGAYGQEAASLIERVRAFDLHARTFVELSNAECGFSYRRSRFNSVDRERFVVTRVDFMLKENGAPLLAYQDLKDHFRDRAKAPTLKETADAVRAIRRKKGMLIVEGDPDCRSAGSFFKNPSVAPGIAERIRQIAAGAGATPRMFPASDGLVKVPAAWLIEQAGFHKGYALGPAAISSRHTLALTNRGSATAEEILALADQIASAVEARFGIKLEREPELVGH